MPDLPIELDHCGIAVNSLDAGQAAFERLGFTLAPRSYHQGAITPGGPVERWGSGNHCAMFRNGYVEVLGIHDPDRHSSARKLLDKYEGLHIVAFGPGDADRAHSILAARSPGINPPAALERDAAYGPDGRETRRARFRNMNLDPAVFPEARFIFTEHLTRDVIWQPHLLDHANGALALHEVALAVEDVAETCARLGKALGREAEERVPGHVALFTLERGQVHVLSGAAVPKWAQGVTPPRLPWCAGLGVTVRDLAATRALLGGNGVPYGRHPYPAVWVGPEHACGTVLSFIQA